MNYSKLCISINEAYVQRDDEVTLRLVKELAEFRVSGRLWQLSTGQKWANWRDIRKDDVVQEILLAVWEAELKPGVQYIWLVEAIIQNKIADFFRERKEYLKWTVSFSDPIGKKNDEGNRDDEGNQLTVLDTIDAEKARRSLQGSYPNEEALRAFSLKADGWDLERIAAELGRSYGTLRNKMSQWQREMAVYACWNGEMVSRLKKEKVA
jgi:DNA-directed RNA polymerase specialized sigma24 family protein